MKQERMKKKEMERIKRAIIIAAGEGRRLRPVTVSTPKPLVKVHGVSFVDTIIDALKANGIHEIYIVTGYKKEQFYKLYREDPDIIILENPDYQTANNIMSLYVAKDYLPGSFIIEGDLMIKNPAIFSPQIPGSGYAASYMQDVPEWALTVRDGRICGCHVKGGKNCYRLWGVSMWSSSDGEVLAEYVKRQVEEIGDTSIFWDEIALFREPEAFDLGIREVGLNDIYEIDTFEELIHVDHSYENYRENEGE